ncbi:urea ABC transporter permease subunit UrtB [Halothiobacillus diazotrophicus]|uniref:Urea ABC transporter permease subunit UrtB n=2 Tax=Halothiobacillus diazotrophicus TaxID=1860122 RepID=A0A191ZJV6_9GAMM|nr:urea ABC transporter permease subunit UrtB [Halothiobacillus diazotrophicus]
MALVITALAALPGWAQADSPAPTTTQTASPLAAPTETQSIASATDSTATTPSITPGSPTIQALTSDSFMTRKRALDALMAQPPADATPTLRALADGQLYLQAKPVARLGIGTAQNDILDPITQQPIGKTTDAGWKTVPINNAIRIKLRPRLDMIDLLSPSVDTRRAAANDLFSARLNSAYLKELKALRPKLTDPAVAEQIKQLIASHELVDADPAVRRQAVEDVAGALDPEIHHKLERIAKSDPDPTVKALAQKTLQSIDTQIAGWNFAQNLVFGLSLGSVLLLAAIGLAITFGVMGVINMAHGELMMIGAYTTWLLQQVLPNHLTLALFLAIPTAFLVAGGIGVLIERGLIRFLYGRPLETLLATFGLSLMLQQAARIIFSPLNRAVALPDFMSNSWVLNPVFAVTYNRLYILIFSLTVFLALLLVLKRSTFGLRIRAVAQNRAMARACGVRSGWIDALTFGLGSGIAGIAGVALSQITNVGPNLGQSYIVDSFMVVVLGGVGNLWGTLVSAMGIGVLNKFLEPYSGAVLAKVVVLVLVILVIQKRPRGLFPQKGRAAEE